MKVIRRYWHWLAIVLLVALVFFVTDRLVRTGSLFGNRPIIINGIAAPPVPMLDPDRVARGTQLYAQHCAVCHGADLEGKPNWKESAITNSPLPPPHDSSGHTWHHKDELLISIIRNGGDPKYNSTMPAFKAKLTENDVVAILDFIKSKWSRQEREFQWWMTVASNKQ